MARTEFVHRLNETKNGNNGDGQPIFKSAAVIGAAGQTGELFTRILAPITHVEAVVREKRWRDEADHPEIRFHDNLEAVLKAGPEAVILAVPNPADKVLQQLARFVQEPCTLILPPNGVDVSKKATQILSDSKNRITLIRASLFTNVSRDEEGSMLYNPRKNRIALASINEDQSDSMLRAQNMFAQAGFDVRIAADYHSMEWSKLIVNLFGTTSTITGLTPREAFSDSEIFALEIRALRDRFRILKAEGIKITDEVWNINQLRRLAEVPEPIASRFRGVIANVVAGERNNQSPAAARQLKAGAKVVESGNYFHKPIIDLGEKNGLRSPVDEAVLDILRRHERANSSFSLTSLDTNERKKLLLEVMGCETKRLFVPSFLPTRFVTNRLFEHFADSFIVKGGGNLEVIASTLAQGQSVEINPNHRSHADHEALMRALRAVLPEEIRQYPAYILANTKFDNELLSGLLSSAYPHPVVYKLGEEDSEEVRWKAHIINRRSAKVIDDLLKNPCIFVVYLEGGRSKVVNEHGRVQLQRAAPGSSSWISDSRFGLVVPTIITGTEKMLPPGQQFLRHADIAVEFCKPIKTSVLKEQCAAVPFRERGDRYYSDIVLRKIADKLDPEERGYYGIDFLPVTC